MEEKFFGGAAAIEKRAMLMLCKCVIRYLLYKNLGGFARLPMEVRHQADNTRLHCVIVR